MSSQIILISTRIEVHSIVLQILTALLHLQKCLDDPQLVTQRSERHFEGRLRLLRDCFATAFAFKMVTSQDQIPTAL